MSAAAASKACDVFVIGGGPAGSTVAALLARRGWSVVVAEKERHPRFHIGESLLPLNLPLLEKLGVHDQIREIAMFKYGAQFTSPQHQSPLTFNFCEAWDKAHPYSYEVRRAEFDKILFDNAIASGVQAFEETRVDSVDFGERESVLIRAQQPDGTPRQWRSRFVVDASGRDTFIANKFGLKRKNRKHNSAAIYAHFAGAKRLAGREEGNLSIFWFEHGWFWFIPLKGDLTSVGAVCWPYYMKSRSTDPTTFFLDTIKLCPALAGRLEQAKLTNRATATGNYSYCAQRMAGDRYLLLGDAYAFIDPVFSSGVMLAMNGAFMATDAIDAYLKDPAAAMSMLQHFERSVRHGIRSFSWFIYRMTNPSMRELFMNPRNYLRMQEALISLLAGDLFRGTPIYGSLRAFKAVYYLTSLCSPLRSGKAWIRRKRAIRDQGDAMIGSKA